MIYEFTREIQGFLTDQSYPVRVIFDAGNELAQVKTAAHRGLLVVIDHDPAGDTLGPPPTARKNPRLLAARMIGAKAEIYAKSSLPGAHRGDHERECEKIVDALIAAFNRWRVEGQTIPVVWAGGKYVPGKDAPDNPREKWTGVCYEITFKVPRGVYDRSYVGEQNPGAARPTGTAASVSNQTRARLEGGDPEADPDIGCGA